MNIFCLEGIHSMKQISSFVFWVV